MAKLIAPKGCIVHSAQIESKGVEVRYRCDGGGEHRYIDRDGVETVGTYPKPAFAKGARAIRFRGMAVTGTGSRVDFVLSPAHAVCKTARSGARKEVVCTLKGDTSSADLRGIRSMTMRERTSKKQVAAARRTAKRLKAFYAKKKKASKKGKR
jgi:hypothetical protein